MFIKFKNKIYRLPDPLPNKSDVIIRVEKYAFVPLSDEANNNPYDFPIPISKLIFFFVHEGIKLTLSKIKSSNFHKKIFAEKKALFVYGHVKGEENFAIAVGPQSCPYSDHLSFPKDLTLIVSRTRNIIKDYQIILEYFRNNPKRLESLYNYSPYSEEVLDFTLENILYESECKRKEGKKDKELLNKLELENLNMSQEKRRAKSKRNNYDLFIAGAGAYSCSYILPNLKKVNYHTIIDVNPILTSVVGKKYNFRYRETSSERALWKLRESKNPILIIASYHSTHLSIVEQALSINPKTKVLVEKPPVTTKEQLKRLLALRKNREHFIEIGYNRRHIPFIAKAKKILNYFEGPVTMTCIIKEKNIPLSHWYYWQNQGTRVTGNLSHWIDLGVYFIQKNPVSITATSASDKFPADEISVSIKFEDDSLLTLVASDRGNQLRGVQEYIEIRCADLTIKIDDFLKMIVQRNGKQRTYRKIIRDKGHIRMYRNFLEQINLNKNAVYPNEDLKISTELYLLISDLLLSGTNHITP